MIDAWIEAMAAAQPQYGPLLQSTVDCVGGLPAIDADGTIRTIRDDLDFWRASGFAKAYAVSRLNNRRLFALRAEYPRCRQVGDEPGLAMALEKGRFYQTLCEWIETAEPLKLPMPDTPDWMRPFLG